jgi:adenylate cyclase class 2
MVLLTSGSGSRGRGSAPGTFEPCPFEPAVEREVKLRFDSPEAALAAVTALGAASVRARRLQDDVLLDDEQGTLQKRGCALRVRRDGETPIGSAEVLLRMFRELGFTPRFRYQKFRTEFRLLDATDRADLIIAIDETPIGVFIELEGLEAAIAAAAGRLGRTPDDYVLASYRTLFLESRAGDMVFDRP